MTDQNPRLNPLLAEMLDEVPTSFDHSNPYAYAMIATRNSERITYVFDEWVHAEARGRIMGTLPEEWISFANTHVWLIRLHMAKSSAPVPAASARRGEGDDDEDYTTLSDPAGDRTLAALVLVGVVVAVVLVALAVVGLFL